MVLFNRLEGDGRNSRTLIRNDSLGGRPLRAENARGILQMRDGSGLLIHCAGAGRIFGLRFTQTANRHLKVSGFLSHFERTRPLPSRSRSCRKVSNHLEEDLENV